MDAITSAQVRGARGMLDWSMFDLARAAGASVSTVKRMEMDGPQPLSGAIRAAVRGALERAGVRFFADDGGGAGVRLVAGVRPAHAGAAAPPP